MKTFIINYIAYDLQGNTIKHGVIKAKNKNNEFEAKVKLEQYLEKKYPNFGRLVINECFPENPFSDIFGNIFGSGFKY